MKKILSVLLTAMLVLTFAACSTGEKTDSGEDTGESTGIPNPFVDCENIDDAAGLAGFAITLPTDIPAGYELGSITAIENEMIQVIYNKGENTLSLRKAAGTDDVSGDYNEYAEVETVSVNGVDVTFEGNDGTVTVASWTDGTYAYAIRAAEDGLSAAEMTALAEELQ